MADQMASPARDKGLRTACLQRLATALSVYPDLQVTVREEGAALCLAARNSAISGLSETVAITRLGHGLVFLWSWGEHIGDANDPDAAAHAIAYVLAAGPLGQ